MGGADFSARYLALLDADIAGDYEEYRRTNAGKNLFKSARTPAVLVSIFLIAYLWQEALQLVTSLETCLYLALMSILGGRRYARLILHTHRSLIGLNPHCLGLCALFWQLARRWSCHRRQRQLALDECCALVLSHFA